MKTFCATRGGVVGADIATGVFWDETLLMVTGASVSSTGTVFSADKRLFTSASSSSD